MELKMEISQNQTISQKMIQSVEILQMNSVDLDRFLKNEALENPLIELMDQNMQESPNHDLQRKLEWLAETDRQNQVYYRQEIQDKNDSIDWKYQQENGELLADYLLSQLLLKELTKSESAIIKHIILSLDSRGYFTDNIAEFAQSLTVSEASVNASLVQVQNLYPAGVGARNLTECLLLQLSRLHPAHGLAREIVSGYLPQLGKNHLPVIARALNASLAEVIEACDIIRRLNPKPGNAFADRTQLKYITPDVIVTKLEDYYEILINEYQYSKITMNQYYLDILKQDPDEETKNYLNQKIKQAEWIKSCVIQRNFTLSRVARAIVENQTGFFSGGPNYKQPLKLNDIAAVLEIHESTVSRTIRDKYLQCSYGVFPMNFFFSSGFSAGTSTASASKAFSPDQIKTRIEEIIRKEDPHKPLSDREITEALSEQKVSISRRTVAKYRESIGIKDAGGRKRLHHE